MADTAADTADRRSLVLSNDRRNRQLRRRYRARKALGVCGHCGKTEVRNRAICYVCTDKKNGVYVKKTLRVA